MKAVRNSIPTRASSSAITAAFWIKAYILKYIMDNWRMVKIAPRRPSASCSTT
jgi:RNA polymerase sigma-32 factor